jgi:glycosyltransferase involved in cell wall biosynthesis
MEGLISQSEYANLTKSKKNIIYKKQILSEIPIENLDCIPKEIGIPFISIVIPLWNESSILLNNVRKVVKCLDKINDSYEVILADDGSTDGTYGLIRKMVRIFPKLVLSRSNRRMGKGFTLKKALKLSNTDVTILMDSDLSVDLNDLSKLLEGIKNGNDMVIGSRYVKDSCVKRPISRTIASRIYNVLVKLLFKNCAHDHQCGFKAFNRNIIRNLVDDVKTDTFFFDTEFIIRAFNKKSKILEVPVKWKEPVGRSSKFKLFRDGLNMGLELIKLRIMMWRT